MDSKQTTIQNVETPAEELTPEQAEQTQGGAVFDAFARKPAEFEPNIQEPQADLIGL